jgi:hypothetical protein
MFLKACMVAAVGIIGCVYADQTNDFFIDRPMDAQGSQDGDGKHGLHDFNVYRI